MDINITKLRCVRQSFLLPFTVVVSFAMIPVLANSEPLSIKCSFDKYADDAGMHRTEFKIDFLVNNDKAYLIGNNGSTEVFKLGSDERFDFLERTGTGNWSFTSISKSTGEDDWLAVHSRHMWLLGEFIPSQYYGDCVIK